MIQRALALTAVLSIVLSLPAAGPRVLPEGKRPADTRLGKLKGEAGDFNFTPAQSPEQWKKRKEEVRRTMLVALGLWPMPTKTPLNAKIHGKQVFDDYTIEKVSFESVPGFHVTGSLYRPRGKKGKRPGVLSPHGHFPGGRFQDYGDKHVRWQVARGEERFLDGGRSFMQSRNVQLARMGCVVFHFDMVGYADSQQLAQELVHKFSRQRVKIKRPAKEGFHSAAAEARLQNIMGLHTYNSIRALDFLVSLPDVDPEKILVTGGSGGGTQTFMLCAVDDRPLVSVPVVIVSTTRQGGCTCENIPLLRIGTYNLEFTALHAPKPLQCISADDATRSLRERGFPELQQHYQKLGKKNNVEHEPLLHFPHNYNHVSRSKMYLFANKHLGLGLDEPILEKPYERLTEKELTVHDDKHPRPDGGEAALRSLLKWLADDADQQLAALKPTDAKTLAEYRRIVGGAVDVMVRQQPPKVKWHETKSTPHESYRQQLGLLRYHSVEGHDVELPMVILTPIKATGRAVVWLEGEGKAGLFAADGAVKKDVRRLLEGGVTVLAADLYRQGEALGDGKPATRARSLPGEEGFCGWTYCYNLPPVAKRAHDVMALASLARSRGAEDVDLVAVNGAAPWASLALAQAPGLFARSAIDTQGFRFARLDDPFDINFLPGGVKYGDVPGLLALATSTKLFLSEKPTLVEAAFNAAGRARHLRAASKVSSAQFVDWLLE